MTESPYKQIYEDMRRDAVNNRGWATIFSSGRVEYDVAHPCTDTRDQYVFIETDIVGGTVRGVHNGTPYSCTTVVCADPVQVDRARSAWRSRSDLQALAVSRTGRSRRDRRAATKRRGNA